MVKIIIAYRTICGSSIILYVPGDWEQEKWARERDLKGCRGNKNVLRLFGKQKKRKCEATRFTRSRQRGYEYRKLYHTNIVCRQQLKKRELRLLRQERESASDSFSFDSIYNFFSLKHLTLSAFRELTAIIYREIKLKLIWDGQHSLEKYFLLLGVERELCRKIKFYYCAKWWKWHWILSVT